jgi:hypothetical protein
MNLVGPIVYTPEEIAFGNKLMQENGMEGKGINGAIKPLRLKEDPTAVALMWEM